MGHSAFKVLLCRGLVSTSPLVRAERHCVVGASPVVCAHPSVDGLLGHFLAVMKNAVMELTFLARERSGETWIQPFSSWRRALRLSLLQRSARGFFSGSPVCPQSQPHVWRGGWRDTLLETRFPFDVGKQRLGSVAPILASSRGRAPLLLSPAVHVQVQAKGLAPRVPLTGFSSTLTVVPDCPLPGAGSHLASSFQRIKNESECGVVSAAQFRVCIGGHGTQTSGHHPPGRSAFKLS